MGTKPGQALSVALYAVLLVLGAFEGLIGSFQYSRAPAPLIAIALDLVLLATCVLAGWGARSLAAALLVGAGWLVTSFIASMGSHEGTVIITATGPGEWYLYGGTLAALLGVLATFVLVVRGRLAQ